MSDDWQDTYDANLKAGNEFEDFVAVECFTRGIVLVNFRSKRYQCGKGENVLGAEIKLDRKFQGTKRLWIETAEKSNPSNAEFVPSGIYRHDNSWLFIIGDKTVFWILATRWLRKLAEKELYETTENETSQAFFLPIEDADKWAARKIVPNQETQT